MFRVSFAICSASLTSDRERLLQWNPSDRIVQNLMFNMEDVSILLLTQSSKKSHKSLVQSQNYVLHDKIHFELNSAMYCLFTKNL